ncbi:MAG: VWA domain-containing protein [Rhodospirillaceae bacterium]|nr:VWA domain-containing protein [Rhodospirillaceae bacterium]
MADKDNKLPSTKATEKDVDAFLGKLARTPVTKGSGVKRGRLMFAMDATASRQPMWDRAAKIQGDMFVETAALGGLDLQLAFYRGFGDFQVSNWVSTESELLKLMTSVFCLAGETQVGKILQHAINETKKQKVNALVFVGDCVEEDVDRLGALAGELGIQGVPAFMFQEGDDPIASFAFKQIAKLTGGACCRFDASSAHMLRDLLGAVAVYAAGGHPALEDMGRKRGGEILKIAHQMKEK